MSSENTTNLYVRAAFAGAVAGIRSMSAPAMVSREAAESDDLEDTPLEPLGSSTVANLLGLAAVGEMVADKLPFIPNRTDPLPLMGRMLFGAVAGAGVFMEEKRSPFVGAAIAAAAAVLSANVSFRIRAALSRRLPGAVAGLIGDAVVALMGYVFLKGSGSGDENS